MPVIKEKEAAERKRKQDKKKKLKEKKKACLWNSTNLPGCGAELRPQSKGCLPQAAKAEELKASGLPTKGKGGKGTNCMRGE